MSDPSGKLPKKQEAMDVLAFLDMLQCTGIIILHHGMPLVMTNEMRQHMNLVMGSYAAVNQITQEQFRDYIQSKICSSEGRLH